MEYSVWNVAPIFLLPFFSFFITAAIVRKAEKLAVFISTAAIFGSFVYAFRIFLDFFTVYSKEFYVHKFFNWMDLSYGSTIFKVDVGIYIDNMTATMLLMVTAVAFLIHLFSTYYMNGDKGGFGRFFVYLSLFTSAMLGLVLSDNLFTIFIFWEIMGFCSYSLIGYYNDKKASGYASIKAFMTTRVGDVFFLMAIVAIWSIVGSVTIPEIYVAIAEGKFSGFIQLFGFQVPLATFIAFSIFMGTIGKSAQFPLFTWLPDAMKGPTPCSALIHAATMVAAGVYLSLRMYPMMEAGHLTLFIAYIGGITAFGAATIALVQTDIKAVLAFSTISQLGYMVLGIGVGSYNAAFMHLITHAVFKACLFLSSGSIIHSLHDHHTGGHVQEMPRMGGLRKKMPLTFLAMLFCSFAISGVPFFSGYVSKDRILGNAALLATHDSSYWIPAVLGFVGALLTAFYMFRMMFLTFFGEPRDKELYEHTHKETFSFNRNLPLLILSVFTLGIWFSGSLTGQGIVKVTNEKFEWFSTLIEKPEVEHFKHYSKQPWADGGLIDRTDFESSKFDPAEGMSEEELHHAHHVHHIGAILSIFIALFGIAFAYFMYIAKLFNPEKWVRTFPRWTKALQSLYYFNDFYVKVLIEKVLYSMNNVSAFIDVQILDRYFVDAWFFIVSVWFKIVRLFDDVVVDTVAVDGTGATVRLFNVVLRTLQSGKIQFYFLMIIIVLSSYIWSLKF